MYYRIREWNKVEAGKYESDQKTFDYKTVKHIAVYRIEKSYGTWTVYKAIDKEEHNEEAGKIYMPVAPDCKTLKEAEEVAEKLFGDTFKLDEVDLA